MNDRIELRVVAGAMRRRLPLVVLVLLLATAAGFGLSAAMPKTYQATTSVLVGETTQTAMLNREELLASQNLATQYSDIARREPVLGRVVESLGLAQSWLQLRNQVQVNPAPGNSQLITVVVEAGSAREARRIARTVVEELIKLSPARVDDPNVLFLKAQIDQLQKDIANKQRELQLVSGLQAKATTAESAQALQARTDTLFRQMSDLRNNYTQLRELLPAGRGPNSLSVLETAAANPDPVRPNVRVNTLVAFGIGLLLSAALSYYLECRRGEPTSPRHLPRGEASAADGQPEPPAALGRDVGHVNGTHPRELASRTQGERSMSSRGESRGKK